MFKLVSFQWQPSLYRETLVHVAGIFLLFHKLTVHWRQNFEKKSQGVVHLRSFSSAEIFQRAARIFKHRQKTGNLVSRSVRNNFTCDGCALRDLC